MKKIIGTLEARMGSSRLPGKTLTQLYDGMSLLECVVKRFKQCKKINDVVVATTTEVGDDLIAEWCEANNISVYRGSENNVLDRVSNTAKEYDANAIVQMGADSAYLDYELIDDMVGHYLNGSFDYVCNDLTLTYPLGIYTHVVSSNKLTEINNKLDLTQEDRDDVVRYIWEHPEQYKIANIEAPIEFQYPQLRLTVDYPEDLEQAKLLYKYFGGFLFTTAQIIDLYKDKPELFAKTMSLKQESAPFIKIT
jgi:spore coat polysaccharide biosynthesis protein SpsF